MASGKKFYKRPIFITLIIALLIAAVAVPTTLALTARQAKKLDVQVEGEEEIEGIKDKHSLGEREWTQMLQKLRANDAKFNNAKLSYTQSYTKTVKHDPFHFIKFGDDPSRMPKDFWEPRKYRLVNDCWLVVRGDDAVLSTQYEPTPLEKYKYTDCRQQYQKYGNLSGFVYRLSDMQLENDDPYKNKPNYEKQLRIRELKSPLAGLHNIRMAIEFVHGIGFGKRIKEISAVRVLGDRKELAGIIKIWSDDISKFKIEIDSDLLVRNAIIDCNVKGSHTRFEVSTQGTIKKDGLRLAKSGTFKRLRMPSSAKEKEGTKPSVQDDYHVQFKNTDMNLTGQRYAELTRFEIEPLMQVDDYARNIHVTGAAYYEKVKEYDEEKSWGEAVEGVQCRLRAEKIIWQSGKWPKFWADLRNNGERKLTLKRRPGTCRLIELDGMWYRPTVDYLGHTVRLSLFPSQQQTDISLLMRLDRYKWQSEEGKQPLEFSPGKHTVRVALRLYSADKGQSVSVVSNPVEITIERALPGSGLSIDEAIKEKTAFAAVCEAVEENVPVLSRTVPGVSPTLQVFKVVEVLFGTAEAVDRVKLNYKYLYKEPECERAIRKHERVIWIGHTQNMSFHGSLYGLKALPDTPENRQAVKAAASRNLALAKQAKLVASGSEAGLAGALDAEQTVAKSPIIYKLRLTQVLEDLQGKVFRHNDTADREILLEAEVLRVFKGDPKAAGQRVVLVWETLRRGSRLYSCLHAEQVVPKHASSGEAVYLMALTPAEPPTDAEGRPRLKNIFCLDIMGTRVSKADVDPKKWATAKNSLERLKLELLSALDDPDANTRHSAIKGLRTWDGQKLHEEPPGGPLWKDERAAARILAASRDPDRRVRWVVAWMIPKEAGEEGRKALVHLLSDTHRDVRQVAAFVLRRRGREDLVKPLLDEPTTDPPPIRSTTPNAAAKLIPAGLPPLADSVQSASLIVRGKATAVTATSVRYKVAKLLHGKLTTDVVTVAIPEKHVASNYPVGRDVIVFLRQPRETDEGVVWRAFRWVYDYPPKRRIDDQERVILSAIANLQLVAPTVEAGGAEPDDRTPPVRPLSEAELDGKEILKKLKSSDAVYEAAFTASGKRLGWPIRKWKFTMLRGRIALEEEVVDIPKPTETTKTSHYGPTQKGRFIAMRSTFYVGPTAQAKYDWVGRVPRYGPLDPWPENSPGPATTGSLNVDDPDAPTYMLHIKRTLWCLGRGYSRHITKIRDISRQEDGRLKVAADGLNMSLRPGAKWELVIDPDAEYMVRSAKLDYRNRRSSFTNSGLKRHGSRCVPEKGECRGGFISASFEFQSASFEADVEFLKRAKATMQPPYLIHTDVSDQRKTPELMIQYDAGEISPQSGKPDWDIGLEDPKQPAMQWGEAVEGLRAAVEFVPEKESYDLEEHVKVRFHIQNVSNEDVQFSSLSARHDWPTVKDSDGKEVKVDGPVFSTGLVYTRRHIIKPGQILTLKTSGLSFGDFHDSALLDKPKGHFWGSVVRCGPGQYSIYYKVNRTLDTGVRKVTVNERPPVNPRSFELTLDQQSMLQAVQTLRRKYRVRICFEQVGSESGSKQHLLTGTFFATTIPELLDKLTETGLYKWEKFYRTYAVYPKQNSLLRFYVKTDIFDSPLESVARVILDQDPRGKQIEIEAVYKGRMRRRLWISNASAMYALSGATARASSNSDVVWTLTLNQGVPRLYLHRLSQAPQTNEQIKADMPDEKDQLVWGEAVDGIQVRLRPDKRIWNEGDDPSFKVDMRNNGTRKLETCHVASIALEVDGKAYAPRIWFQLRTIGVSPFGPGSEYTIKISLSNFRLKGKGAEELTPGKHTIRAVYLDNRDDSGIHTSLDNYSKMALAFSNPVEITIGRALPGSGLSIDEAIKEKAAFAAVCEAVDEFIPTTAVVVSGGAGTVLQEFKVVEVLFGKAEAVDRVKLNYKYLYKEPECERAIRKHERVIWIGHTRNMSFHGSLS